MKKLTALVLALIMTMCAMVMFTACDTSVDDEDESDSGENTVVNYSAGAAGMTINDERKEEVDFSHVYYSSTIVVVSAKDKAYADVASLSGLTVGVQEGTSGDLIVSAAKTEAGYEYTDYDENDNEITKTVKVDASTEVRQYKQYALAFADLKAGRIEAIVMDKLPAQTMMVNADSEGAYTAIDAADLLFEDFGIALKKGDTEFAAMVNAVIDEWVADGTMTKYVEYYEALAAGETPDAGDLKVTWDFGNAKSVLTMYTESGFAPFEFVMSGKITGVDVAIMSEVAVRNNMKLVVKDVAFDTITACVKGN